MKKLLFSVIILLLFSVIPSFAQDNNTVPSGQTAQMTSNYTNQTAQTTQIISNQTKYCTYLQSVQMINNYTMSEENFPRGTIISNGNCSYGVRVLSVSSNSANIVLYYNNGESEQLNLNLKEPKKLSDNINYIILLGAYPSTNETIISLTNSENPDLCAGGTCPSCEESGEDYNCFDKSCPTTGYEPIDLPCNHGVCCKKIGEITSEKVYTDKSEYSEGDYVNVFVELPYVADTCELYLTSPQGEETLESSSGCGPFDKYKPPNVNEHGLVDRTEFTGFLSSNEGYLDQNYGTWGIRVAIIKNGQNYKNITTSFNYTYFNRIIGYCTLTDTNTKSCEFLGSQFEITKDNGCGPNPVNIKINYFGGEKSVKIAQGEDDLLTVGLIVVRNMGSPCSADVLNLRFDKLITVEETSVNISSEDNKIETEMSGKKETFSLPTEDKAEVIEAKVKEEGSMEDMSVEVDNANKNLILKSNNVTVGTNLSVSIEGSQLYLGSSDKKVEVNVLPDKALEKVKSEISSPENIEIQNEGLMYSIKGSNDAKILGIIPTKYDVEAKLDTQTGNVKNIDKPWWSFLAW